MSKANAPIHATTPAEWMNSYIPIGTVRGDSWNPVGAGVLIIDVPVMWLVTAGSVVEQINNERIATWVRKNGGVGLVDLSSGQEQNGIGWIHHPECDIAATLFPVDQSFEIKAFAEQQFAQTKDLYPLLPMVAVSALYGADLQNPGYPAPAALEGAVTRVDHGSGRIFTSAPLLPCNTGAPLILASPHSSDVALAGILVDTLVVPETNPNVPPLRLSVAVGMEAVTEMLRSSAAEAQRQLASPRGEAEVS